MVRVEDATMSVPILSAAGLSKHFGGVVAVNEVSLDLHIGQVHAVIGTNGAGKSTLTNLLSGEIAPDAGSIRHGGCEIAGLPAERIARLGIGRSHQRTSVFPAFSVRENIRLAAQSRQPRAWQVWRIAASHLDVNAEAERVMTSVGLDSMRDTRAAELSHGAQRQLEIALCLATAPKVLLLDEPLAGMGAAESGQVIELIRRLKSDHAILLIEHDMDAVFAIADRITVMVDGRVIASGMPDEIRADPRVQQAYLGEAVAKEDWHG
jgi:branched-chain amino acid transport system ATP-binding protein